MKLQKLFKKSSKGVPQEWEIEADGNVIITRWGYVGGAIQETRDEIKSGKNDGKANATTAEQQAQREAISQWEKKLKKGYVKSLDDAAAGKVDELITGGHFPMLADKFRDHGDKVSYPVYVQPKFDGHRCIVVVESGEPTMWTRTRKPITGLPHIIAAVREAMKKAGITDIVLDGELYNHAYRNNFEDLTSFIRNPSPKPGHEVVQYHIYDIVDLNALFEQRHQTIQGLQLDGKTLVEVPTFLAEDEDHVMEIFEGFLRDGFEGLMVRIPAGKYISHPSKRSKDLLKVKKFDDAEFMVVGVEEGRGRLTGKAIFVCTTAKLSAPSLVPLSSSVLFRAKMKGKIEDLEKYIKDPSLAIGRMLTVQYFGMSNKNNVPRFPVGLRFRED